VHLKNYNISFNELENLDVATKGIVVTGNFEQDREIIKIFLMKLGGQIKPSITGNVDLVFAGNDAGWAKIQKIDHLNQSGKANIKILNENDLNYLITKFGI
jgi:BRCT domain type II-containing protein